MQDLTLVGVHEDGEHVLLAAADGQRYRLKVDEPLRAAVRRDRPRLGRLQLELDGKIRPRDIQARIRAGQTAEHIAEVSGLALEHVQRFEGPVLAEREHVAQQARRVPMRRTAGVLSVSGSAPTLDEVVTERLARREVDPFTTIWDAWRTEERGWIVKITFAAAGRERSAHWAYDMNLRHLTPQDDEARWLTDAEPPEPAASSGQRRLTPVRDRVFDVEAQPPHLTADRDQPAAPSSVEMLDSLRARRGRRAATVDPDSEVSADPYDQTPPRQARVEVRTDPLPQVRHDPPPADPDEIDLVLLREDDPSPPRRTSTPVLSAPERDPEPLGEPAGDSPAPALPEARSGRRAMPPADPPAAAAPATRTPAARPPATRAPATQAPATQAPATRASATPAPAAPAPATPAAEPPPPSAPARPAARAGKPAKPHPGTRTRQPTPAPEPPPAETPEPDFLDELTNGPASRSAVLTQSGTAAEANDRPEEPAAKPKPAARPAKKKTRASVPSWDDIVFGGRRE